MSAHLLDEVVGLGPRVLVAIHGLALLVEFEGRLDLGAHHRARLDPLRTQFTRKTLKGRQITSTSATHVQVPDVRLNVSSGMIAKDLVRGERSAGDDSLRVGIRQFCT